MKIFVTLMCAALLVIHASHAASDSHIGLPATPQFHNPIHSDPTLVARDMPSTPPGGRDESHRSVQSFGLTILASALLGAIAGLIGGLIGGGLNGYFNPITKVVQFDLTGRLALARVGAVSAMRIGALAGLVSGAAAGWVGSHFQPFAFVVIVGLVLWIAARWLVQAVGESIVGLPGGIVLGGMLGTLGGYAASLIP